MAEPGAAPESVYVDAPATVKVVWNGTDLNELKRKYQELKTLYSRALDDLQSTEFVVEDVQGELDMAKLNVNQLEEEAKEESEKNLGLQALVDKLEAAELVRFCGMFRALSLVSCSNRPSKPACTRRSTTARTRRTTRRWTSCNRSASRGWT